MYLLTRRCSGRVFRLRPSFETTNIIKYALALALAKTGVILHAVCVMSNHVHLVVTDVRGRLPDFLREFHRSCAKALNALHERTENFWAAEPCSAVLLGTDEDVISKIAYVVNNPVAAGLVSSPEEWPGLLRWGESTEAIARPKVYFAKEGRSPDWINLPLEWPTFALARGISSLRRLRKEVVDGAIDARRAILAAGKHFLGRARILKQSIDETPRSMESSHSAVPVIAARDREEREAMRRVMVGFRRAYRHALAEWRTGLRAAVFPFGTWWMRVHHGAAIGERDGSPALVA